MPFYFEHSISCSLVLAYDGYRSSSEIITCGIPQEESILGPILVFISITDLYHVCYQSIPTLFAFDTNLFVIRSIKFDLENETVKNCKAFLCGLISTNSPLIQIKLVIWYLRDLIDKIPLYIGINFYQRSSTLKISWSYYRLNALLEKHILYLSGTISRGIGIIIKASISLNLGALLYKSSIYKYMPYCNLVRGTVYVANFRKIVPLQKRSYKQYMLWGSSLLRVKFTTNTKSYPAKTWMFIPFQNLFLFIQWMFMHRFSS